jgi:hypothetical protein
MWPLQELQGDNEQEKPRLPGILPTEIMCQIGLIFYLYSSKPILLTYYERSLFDFEERTALSEGHAKPDEIFDVHQKNFNIIPPVPAASVLRTNLLPR